MFDDATADPDHARCVVGAGTVGGWVHALAGVDRAVDDRERVEQIRVLEELKAAAAAAQAVATADLMASQRAQQRARGVPAADLGRGVGAQVALARRDSPFRGSRHVGLAQALVHEMPHTMAALRAGRISEWRATIVARETACLTRQDRRVADEELAGRLGPWETPRPRPRPAPSPTGSIPPGSPPGPGAPSETGGSRCAPPRTR